MVFMVVDRKFKAFGNVRLALVPCEAGNIGELRITSWNHVQHRAYNPLEPLPDDRLHEFGVPVGMVDELATEQFGCDIRLITLKGYEYWLMFPTDADATIFYRLLMERVERIIDEDGPEWPDAWDSSGEWTWDIARWMPVPGADCRCHLQGPQARRLMSAARREAVARQVRADEEAAAAAAASDDKSEPKAEEEVEVEEDDDDGQEEDEEEEEEDDEDEDEVPEEEFVMEDGIEALRMPLQVIFEEENGDPLPEPENLSQRQVEPTCEANIPNENLPGTSNPSRTYQSRPSISPSNQYRPRRRRTEE